MVLGPNLILDPGFDDPGYWTIGTGWAVVGSKAVGTEIVSGDAISKSQILEVGKDYQFEVTLSNFNNAGSFAFRASGYGTPFSTNGTHTEILRATSDRAWISGFSTGASGDFDDFSVKEVLPNTTVEVTWIDSVSAASTGNKIYRDDVEIADIGMGVQTYPDDTAETGTTYKYEVQAYSATDETTQEVTGVNTQTITTA